MKKLNKKAKNSIIYGLTLTLVSTVMATYLYFLPHVEPTKFVSTPSVLEGELMEREEAKELYKKPLDELINDPEFINQLALEKEAFGFPEESGEIELIYMSLPKCGACIIGKKIMEEEGYSYYEINLNEARAIRKLYGLEYAPSLIIKNDSRYSVLYGVVENQISNNLLPCTISPKNIEREIKKLEN